MDLRVLLRTFRKEVSFEIEGIMVRCTTWTNKCMQIE